MGRGGTTEKALNSASQLLFGPRRGAPVPQTRKRINNREAQRQKRAANKAEYLEQAAAAQEAVFDGDGAPLAELLAEPAGHGLKGEEKKLIKKLAEKMNSHQYKAGRVRDDSITPFLKEEDLEALILLYDRCSERGLSNGDITSAASVANYYAAILANQRARKQLEADQQKIGPLPSIIDGDDFVTHIESINGGAACGNADKMVYDPRHVDQHKHSAASAELECKQCWASFNQKGKNIKMLGPKEWADLFDQIDYQNWGDSFNLGRSAIENSPSDSADERAKKMIDYYHRRVIDEVNHRLESFTDYRL